MLSKKTIILLLLMGLVALVLPATSHAQVAVGVSVRIGPPVLPVYVQPVCPAPGYLWTPGYWAYGPDGYYWVPGVWVEPPEVGLLWTPGYWAFDDGFYVWRPGYWGPHVGFYGGINYGFGYGGVGFVGGFWRGGVFSYNRAVTNVNVTVIHNTYINNTVVNRGGSRVAFNGGAGGVRAFPNREERSYERERHFEATGSQTHHQEMARGNREQLYSANHGHPGIAASPRAGVYEGKGVVKGNTGNYSRGNDNYARGKNNPNTGNFDRGNNNYARGKNNPNTGNFDRGNNSAKVYKGGNGPQGGNPKVDRNYDRRAQNNGYAGPRGGNPNSGNPHGGNSNTVHNQGGGNNAAHNQGGKESHSDKHDRH